jgi:hypothetical protein
VQHGQNFSHGIRKQFDKVILYLLHNDDLKKEHKRARAPIFLLQNNDQSV